MRNEVRQCVEAAGCIVARSLVGNFVTSLDMVGGSVTGLCSTMR
jgi:dihydroxyacetone kinase